MDDLDGHAERKVLLRIFLLACLNLATVSTYIYSSSTTQNLPHSESLFDNDWGHILFNNGRDSLRRGCRSLFVDGCKASATTIYQYQARDKILRAAYRVRREKFFIFNNGRRRNGCMICSSIIGAATTRTSTCFAKVKEQPNSPAGALIGARLDGKTSAQSEAKIRSSTYLRVCVLPGVAARLHHVSK